jgi:hypothetical protein
MKRSARWTRLSLLGGATSLFAFSSAALAQNLGNPISFGVVAGASIPLGDFADFAGTGWHAGGLLQWDTPTLPIGFRVDGVYHKFGEKDENGAYPSWIVGTLDAVWSFPMTQPYTVRPYLIGGGGIYNQRCDGCSSQTNFGINGGAGITVPLSGFTTIIEARFHFVLDSDVGTSNSTMIPISVGLLFR